jgi:SAM-dependent methyltransferase
VGCGPGSHAEYLQSLGLNVMCVDISEEMLKKCESRGLKTLLVDLEHLHFPDATIDGIWAYASLLHVRKEIIPKIARNFARMLKPKGILAIGVKKGNGEGFETREKMPESKWYFSYFQDDEMRKYFSPYFEIIDFSEETARGSTFLHYIMRKR